MQQEWYEEERETRQQDREVAEEQRLGENRTQQYKFNTEQIGLNDRYNKDRYERGKEVEEATVKAKHRDQENREYMQHMFQVQQKLQSVKLHLPQRR